MTKSLDNHDDQRLDPAQPGSDNEKVARRTIIGGMAAFAMAGGLAAAASALPIQTDAKADAEPYGAVPVDGEKVAQADFGKSVQELLGDVAAKTPTESHPRMKARLRKSFEQDLKTYFS